MSTPQQIHVGATIQNPPSLLVRILWYLVIGWWMAEVWLVIGYLLCISIIGLPLGLVMLNRLPTVMTLRPQRQQVRVIQNAQGIWITSAGDNQAPFLLRALYFLLIGWWFGLIWSVVGCILCHLVITLPIGVLMLDRVPGALTLYRY